MLQNMQKSVKFPIFSRTSPTLSQKTSLWSPDQDRSDRSWSKTVAALHRKFRGYSSKEPRLVRSVTDDSPKTSKTSMKLRHILLMASQLFATLYILKRADSNELPSSAVLRKDQAHFTEPRGLARGLNTTNENQNLLYQAIRPSSG